MRSPPSSFDDMVFVNYVLPVIRLYGFDVRPHQVHTIKDCWTINIGRDQNWVATLIGNKTFSQHVLMMTLYDGDFAADAFLVKYKIEDDDSVKVLDEENNIDVSIFPTYDELVDPNLPISLKDVEFKKND